LQNATFFCEIGDRPRFLQTHTDGKGGGWQGKGKDKGRERKVHHRGTEARKEKKRGKERKEISPPGRGGHGEKNRKEGERFLATDTHGQEKWGVDFSEYFPIKS
jgi:hypothetical protein